MTHNYVDWKGWQGVDFGSFKHEEDLYYKLELEKSGVVSLHGLRIGELGYGNGSFAGWCNKQGGKWVGRELSSELQQRAMLAGYKIAASHENFSDVDGKETFDLIVAFDVIEHLNCDDIRKFLAECKEALKLNGILIFRIPSGDSPFSGAIYHGDLTHRTFLGSSAARQIAEEVGFDVMQIRSPALPVRGLSFIRSARRLIVLLLQNITYSFIRHFLMGHESAVISPNMIVVLKKV